jgi:chromosome segregation ATPase
MTVTDEQLVEWERQARHIEEGGAAPSRKLARTAVPALVAEVRQLRADALVLERNADPLLADECDALKAEVERLREQHEAFVKRTERVDASADRAIETLTAERDAAIAEVARLGRELGEAQAAVDSAVRERDAALARAEAAEAELSDLQRESFTYRTESAVAILRTVEALDAAEKRVAELEGIAEYEATCKRLALKHRDDRIAALEQAARKAKEVVSDVVTGCQIADESLVMVRGNMIARDLEPALAALDGALEGREPAPSSRLRIVELENVLRTERDLLALRITAIDTVLEGR